MKIWEPDHLLKIFEISRIITMNNGNAPLTYHDFVRIISRMKLPPTPTPTLSLAMIGHGVTPVSGDHDIQWGVPTLPELGKFDLIGDSR